MDWLYLPHNSLKYILKGIDTNLPLPVFLLSVFCLKYILKGIDTSVSVIFIDWSIVV